MCLGPLLNNIYDMMKHTDRYNNADFHDIELQACMGHRKHTQGHHEIEDHCVFGDALSLIIHAREDKAESRCEKTSCDNGSHI